MKPWETVFDLCDIVRETGFAIHTFLRNGHLEKVYQNALMYTAKLLGYLRCSRMEHGLLMNFGAPRFFIKKYILSDALL